MPKFAEVVERTREVVKISQGDWIMSDYAFCAAVAEPLGVKPGTAGGYREQAEWDSFCGQVGRALEKLAEEGDLVKVSRGQCGPDGQVRAYNRFYLPARYQQLKAVTALVPYLAPSMIDGEYPIVCANGCPLGYIGRHKMSCDEARAAKGGS